MAVDEIHGVQQDVDLELAQSVHEPLRAAMPGESDELRETERLRFHKGRVGPLPAEHDFRIHFIGADTMDKDQVRIAGPEFFEAPLEQQQRAITVGLIAFRDEKHLGSDMLKERT